MDSWRLCLGFCCFFFGIIVSRGVKPTSTALSILERSMSIRSNKAFEKFDAWWDHVYNDSNILFRVKRNTQMVISQHFTETTVMPGVDISLQCTVNGAHPTRFWWERDGIVISSNTDSRYTIGQTMSQNGGVVTSLNISHLRVEDGGLFSCVAHYGESNIAYHDRLNVYGPPYIRTLPPFKAHSGQTVTLRCPYYGYPIRDITWEYKGKEITTERFKRSFNNTALSIEIFGRKPKLRFTRNTINNFNKSEENSSPCIECNINCINTTVDGEILSIKATKSDIKVFKLSKQIDVNKLKSKLRLRRGMTAKDGVTTKLNTDDRQFRPYKDTNNYLMTKLRLRRITKTKDGIKVAKYDNKVSKSLEVKNSFKSKLRQNAISKYGVITIPNNTKTTKRKLNRDIITKDGVITIFKDTEASKLKLKAYTTTKDGVLAIPNDTKTSKLKLNRDITTKDIVITIPNDTKMSKLKLKSDMTTKDEVITISNDTKASKLRLKRDATTNDGVLTIPKVTKSDNGVSYSCIVKSPSGEMAKRSFELNVVEAPQLEEILLASDLQEGQIVQIHCNLKSGDSPVYYSWLKDGKKISNHLKIVERSLEVFSVLIIKNVSLEHCGTYTCVAANHVAKVNRTVNLYIKVAPKWNDEPQNTSLLLGRSGHIACSANGYPQPQTHWLKKDVVSESWRPVLEIAGGGVLSLANGSLIFDSVALTDAGLYTCHVENGVGEALSKTIWISVNKPVTFDILSRNMTAKLGQQVTIECQAKGDDPIRIMWTRNGKPINPLTQRVKISEMKSDDGITNILELLQTETTDGALYQCRAGNPFGADVYSVHLTILEPPLPPSDLSIDSLKSRSVKLSWRDIARSLAQYYSVQITSSQRLSWSSARTVNVTRLEEIRHSVEIEDLLPSTSYTARVAGGNQADLSHYSTPVRFSTTEEAPTSPPIGIQLEQTDAPGELRVRWLPPPADTHNGLIIGYRLRAVPQLNGIKEAEETSDKTVKTASLYAKQETTVTGLLKGVRYAVSVAAFNGAGPGPYSVPLFQDTREGAPEEGPTSVECGAVTSTALRVSWQPIPPHKQAGALIGYTVLYAAHGRQWLNATSLVTEIRLQGLLKYTNYTIKLAGFSNYGLGPFSYPIVCPTLQDVPESPAEIKLLSQSSNTLLVSWKKPRQPNGKLLHYTVYCKPTSSNDGPHAMRVDAELPSESFERSQTVELKGLVEGRQYDVWVTASTGVGEGPESKRVTNTPLQRVVAGVASLGGPITVAVRNSLLLECRSVGSPPPRTVWYHNQNIITHHPRFNRNRDDSLLIKNIDQSLSGNYTCLAKNLYGSDSVVYTVKVLPLPDPPVLRATPYKDYIVVEWDEIKNFNDSSTYGISYNLTYRESDGPWLEAWPVTKESRISGTQQHTLAGLKCGTKYSVRVTATDSIGTSAPAHVDVITLGSAPVSPPSTDWLWSNATHIYIQLSGWDNGGCDVTKWDVDYRPLGSNAWINAENKAPMDINLGWSYIEGHYQAPPLRSIPTSYAVGELAPASWYQLRVTATNDAGTANTIYNYATKNINGEEIGPPSEFLDLNMLVIICSSVLLVVCLMAFICILLKRHRHSFTSQYRHSIAEDAKSRHESVTSHSEHKDRYASAAPRIYTSPAHQLKGGKSEMFEISPYAEFALGFRTFDHVENQDLPMPSRLPSRPRFDTETSFQTRSESDDSDSTSKATVKVVPRRHCRTPHHNR